MSRAFVKEDSGGNDRARRYALLPPRDDPGFDAAAARALLEAARAGETGAGEEATGYYWGEPRLSRLSVLAARFALLALLAAPGVAQTSQRVAGRAIDTDGQPVVGARIVLEPSGRSTVSEDNGAFSFAAVTAGSYRLAGMRIGYKPAAVAVDVRSGSDISVVLVFTPIPVLLDSVRVRERMSGSRYDLVVVNDFGDPVPGADVEFFTTTSRTKTDSLGRTRAITTVRGTFVVRVRKIGYAPVFKTVRLLGDRDDTVHIQRIAQLLAAAQVLERSGFGSDTFVFRDFAARMRWRGTQSGVISRDELDAQGRTNLCDAMRATPTGAKLGLLCTGAPILIDGVRQSCNPLSSFYADQVEAVEYYPPGTDWSGSLGVRVPGACGGRTVNRSSRPSRQAGGFVIWMRPSKR